MTDKQKWQLEGMDMLLQKFNACSDDTVFTVRDIVKASNEVYKNILSEDE